MKQIVLISFAVFAIVLISAIPAFAGVGLHAGLSLDPDDFLVGLHFNSNPLAESLVLVPSVEAGFGDVTMIAGNLDLHYVFKTGSKLAPYVGGGGTLNWFDFKGGSSLDFGGSVLGGIDLTKNLYLEGKLGLGDVPDWKFYVGFKV